MISDVLRKSEESIEDYLEEGSYGEPGDRIRAVIENLVKHMEAVRNLPGLDAPPVSDEAEALYVEAVQIRWPDVPSSGC
jgi:hypothetical protein